MHNFFLKYSRINKQNMFFSRNGVRIWNSLSNEFRQMPKTKFKRNIYNMLLQKLSEANDYILFVGFGYALKTELIIFALSFQLLM